ncbi:MAG TPA: NAD-binding protein [Ktedonobacterales bacterium]
MADTSTTAPRAPRQIRQRRSPWQLLRANFYDIALLLRDSYLALIGFGIVMAIGTLYLQRAERLSIPAALYESLRLLIFQSSFALPADLIGALIFFLIPLVSILLVAQGVLAFGRRLLDKGSRVEAWQVALASTYHQHVIVCGLGRVGIRVATRLIQAGYEVAVVERAWDSDQVARALAMHIPVVVGDAREPVTLRQAGLQRAKAVIAVVNDDLVNVEIALACRASVPGIRVILRAFHEEVDRNLERLLGPDVAFSTSALAAPTYAAAALHRGIDYVLTIGHSAEQLAVATLTLPPGESSGGDVATFERQRQVRVLPTGAGDRAPTTLSAGKPISLIGSLPSIAALRSAAMPSPGESANTVLVCGVGKVGYRVVRQLAENPEHPQVIALHDATEQHVSGSYAHHIIGLPNVSVREGDVRHTDVLEAAGLGTATAVAALTSNDFVNLQVALAARHARPDVHIVLRVFSDALAERLVDLFGIHTTYSTSDLAAPTLAAAAVLPGATQAFFANGALFSTDPRLVSERDGYHGRTVGSLREHDGLLVVALCRDGLTTTLPEPETGLAPGDEITLLAPLKTLTRMHDV